MTVLLALLYRRRLLVSIDVYVCSDDASEKPVLHIIYSSTLLLVAVTPQTTPKSSRTRTGDV
jgi:hypothetical protein